MKRQRIIARLDVKNDHVIKGIHLEGLRKIGDPVELAKKYYEDGADELLFQDAVASLYERNNLFHIIEKACQNVFIPITIGGGLRSIRDIEEALKTGADKVSINTAAIKNPQFINEAAKVFGSQCIVGSVEVKRRRSKNGWEAFVDNGRESTGVDAVEWIKKLEDLGAGEIVVTSVDQEGTKKGFDINLAKTIAGTISIPFHMSGGAGSLKDITKINQACLSDALVFASLLHYNKETVSSIKEQAAKDGIEVRR